MSLQGQRNIMRTKILEPHANAPLILEHIRGRSSALSKCSSIADYVKITNMDKENV